MSRYKVKRKQTPGQQLRSEAGKVNWILWAVTLASVAVIFGVYQLCVQLNFKYIVHIYAVLLGIFTVCYAILNRGFYNKTLTLEELPGEWTVEQKEAFLSRGKKAKYFLIPVIGILLTFAYDIIFLFYLDPLL